MSRALQAILALGLFIGVSLVTRHYYREWMQTTMKESVAASKKETAKWKSAKGNFGDIKITQPIITVPKFEPTRRPANRGNSPIRSN